MVVLGGRCGGPFLLSSSFLDLTFIYHFHLTFGLSRDRWRDPRGFGLLAMCHEIERNGRPQRRSSALALVLLGATVLSPLHAGATEVIAVVLDQARMMVRPKEASTVIIGNPLIADVSVQPNNLMIITGKAYGTTNLVALDRAGTVILDTVVEVRGPPQALVVYRGIDRESYLCAPKCERQLTLGDTPQFFDNTLQESGSRTAAAER